MLVVVIVDDDDVVDVDVAQVLLWLFLVLRCLVYLIDSVVAVYIVRI